MKLDLLKNLNDPTNTQKFMNDVKTGARLRQVYDLDEGKKVHYGSLSHLIDAGVSNYKPNLDSEIEETALVTRPDQPRPDQTRPDQTRPDQTRPDQTRPDLTRPRPDPTRPNPTRPDRPDPKSPQPPTEVPGGDTATGDQARPEKSSAAD
eukprot:scaffold20326_cov54-Phaeocystis_antarctica.AAC.1